MIKKRHTYGIIFLVLILLSLINGTNLYQVWNSSFTPSYQFDSVDYYQENSSSAISICDTTRIRIYNSSGVNVRNISSSLQPTAPYCSISAFTNSTNSYKKNIFVTGAANVYVYDVASGTQVCASGGSSVYGSATGQSRSFDCYQSGKENCLAFTTSASSIQSVFIFNESCSILNRTNVSTVSSGVIRDLKKLDLDGDGYKNNLVVAYAGTSTVARKVSTLNSLGSINWTADFSALTSASVSGIDGGNLTSNTGDEVAIAFSSQVPQTENISIYDNSGTRLCTVNISSSFSITDGDMIICDINNDGNNEIAYARNGGAFIINSTCGIVYSNTSIPGGNVNDINCGDLDGDGSKEVVISTSATGFGLSIYNYSLSISQNFTTQTVSTTRTSQAGLRLFDLNKDGTLDLISASPELGLSYFIQTPSAPTITFIDPTPGNNTWNNSNQFIVNVTGNVSSLNSGWITFNGTNYTMNCSGNSPFYCSYNFSSISDGTYNYTAYVSNSINVINNTETRTIKIDTTGPVTTSSATSPPGGSSYTFDTWSNQNVKVTLTSFDAGIGFDNLAYPIYCVDQTNTCTPTFYIGSGVTISTEGTNYIRYSSTDTLGNVETTQSKIVKIDKSAPLLSIISPTNYQNFSYNTSLPLNFSVSDSLNSVNSCWYSTDGGITNITILSCLNTTFNVTEGLKNITLYANDTLGNLNSTYVTFRTDITGPIITIISPQNIIYKDLYTYNLSLNISASDLGIGISSYWYSLNGGTSISFTPNITLIAPAGINNLTVYSNDTLGNVGSSFVNFNLSFTPKINDIITHQSSIIANFENSLDGFGVDCGGAAQSNYVQGVNGLGLQIYSTGGDHLACAFKTISTEGLPENYTLYFWGKGGVSTGLYNGTDFYSVLEEVDTGCTTSPGWVQSIYVSCNGGNLYPDWKLFKMRVHTAIKGTVQLYMYKQSALGDGTAYASYMDSLSEDAPIYQRNSILEGLVAWWKLDENNTNQIDSSSNGNNLTSIGATFTEGKIGQAYNFNGDNQYMSSNFNLPVDTTTSGYTMSAWVKCQPNALNVGGWANVVGDNSAGFSLDAWNDCNYAATYTGGNSGGAPALPYNIANSWHMLTAVWIQNATGFIPTQMYLDGVYFGNSTTDRFIPYASTPNIGLNLGYVGYNARFNGTIDEVRVYNRSLSKSEIKNLYSLTNPSYQEYPNITINTTIIDEDTPQGNLYYNWLVDGVSVLTGFAQNILNWIFVKQNQQVDLYVNDSNNYTVHQNWNVSTTFIYPTISFISPTPISGTNQSSTSFLINITGQENNVNDSWVTLNGSINYTMNCLGGNYNTSTYYCYYNLTSLSDGNKFYQAFVRDKVGNINKTEIRNITIDTTYPLISYIDPTPVNYANVSQTNIFINLSITETNIKDISYYLYNSSLPSGLYAYWSFDRNTTNSKDLSGNFRDTTNYGAIWNQTGKLGADYEFDGINDYIKTFQNFNATNYTYCAWFKTNAPATTMSDQEIISVYGNPYFSRMMILGDGTFGELWYGGTYPSSRITIQENIWYHGCFVYGNINIAEASGTIYLNGSNVTTSSVPMQNGYYNNYITIGAHISQADFFNGSIDEVMIFNRSLSPEEISNIYNRSLINHTTYTTQINSINFTNLPQGNYHYYSEVIDYVDQFNFTSIRSILLDLTNPNAILLYPTNNSYNSTLTQNFTANLTDNFGINDSKLHIWKSGTEVLNQVVSVIVGAVAQTVSYVWNGLTEGIYIWFYEVIDIAGNKNYSSNNTLTIDLTPPVISLVYPVDGSSININDSINLNFTASDLYLDSCWFNLNNGTNISIPSCQNTTFNASEGNYYIYIYANDSANNIGSDSHNFEIALGPPGITLNFPTNNQWLNYSNVQFNYTPTHSVGVDTCELWGNFTGVFSLNQSDSSITNNQVNSFNLNLNDNSYLWAIWCNSTAGTGGFSLNRTVRVDANAPKISYSSGTAVNYANLSQTNIFVNVSVIESNQDTIIFNLYNSSSLVNSTSSTSQLRSLNWTNLPNAIYQYNITINDSAGNINYTETRTITLDNTKPSITIYSPLAQNYANNNSMLLNISVMDNLIGVNECWYYVYNSTGSLIIGVTSIANCQNATFALPGGDINYNLYVFASDKIGNLNSSSVIFGIRTESPAIVLSPINDTYRNYLTNHYFNFTVSSNTGMDTCQLWLNDSGWHLNQTKTSISTNSVNSFNPINLSEGIHYWNVWCNDTLNHSGFALNNNTLILDVTYPKINITSPNNNSNVDTTFTFNFTVNETNLNFCYYNLLTGGNWYYSPNQSISCSIGYKELTLSSATYELYFWSLDKANNLNSSSRTFTVTTSTTSGGGGGSTEVIKEVNITKTSCGDGICQAQGNDAGLKEDFYTCAVDCPGANVDSILWYCIDNNPNTFCVWGSLNYQYFGLFFLLLISIIIFSTVEDKKTGKQIPTVKYIYLKSSKLNRRRR